MAESGKQDKMERLKELFPDAVGDDGELNCDLLNQEIKKAKTGCEQPKCEAQEGTDECQRKDEKVSAEQRVASARFGAWADIEREANRMIILVSGVVVGFLFNAIIRDNGDSIHWLAWVAVALLAFTVLFIILSVYAIDSRFLQRKAFAHLRESDQVWSDNPTLAIKLTARMFMLIPFLPFLPEEDGESIHHIKVKRGGCKKSGRVDIRKLNILAYRTSRFTFILGIAISATFFVWLTMLPPTTTMET